MGGRHQGSACLQFKTSEIAHRCAGLIRVNIYKDSIVNAERLPPLPGMAALTKMLEPHFEALQQSGVYVAHCKPTYNVTDAEKAACVDFLTVHWLLHILLSLTSLVQTLILLMHFNPSKARNKSACISY